MSHNVTVTAMSCRTWRFTLNNPTEAELDMVKLWEVTRCAITSEVGDTGTPHFQGFITFPRTYRLASLKKLAPRAHWEVSATADWNYELKTDSTIVRVEDNRKPGARKDIDLVYDAVAEGKGLPEFLAERPSLCQIKLFEKLRAIHPPRDRQQPLTVIWIYGPTGTGKTKYVYDTTEAQGLVPFRPVSFKWWEGYTDQPVVLLDDFRGDWCKFHELLVLFDRYPRKVEYKGGSVDLVADTFYVTSCSHPRDVYSKTDEDVQQLLRRITRIEHFNAPL